MEAKAKHVNDSTFKVIELLQDVDFESNLTVIRHISQKNNEPSYPLATDEEKQLMWVGVEYIQSIRLCRQHPRSNSMLQSREPVGHWVKFIAFVGNKFCIECATTINNADFVVLLEDFLF